MKRKVIKLAEKTLMISLPTAWAKKYGIEKGAELEVEEAGNELRIRSEKSPEKKISVNVSRYSASVVKWILSALYKTGYTEIELIYEDPALIAEIRKNVKNSLMGFITKEETKTRVVLKSVVKSIDQEFDPALRRAFLVTLELADKLLESMKNNDSKELPGLLALEQTNNQLTNFCERIIGSSNYPDHGHFMYVIAWNLEKVCDEYRDICKYLIEHSKLKVGDNILKLFEEVNYFLRAHYESFYDFDLVKFDTCSKRKEKIIALSQKNLAKNSLAGTFITNKLLSISSKIEDFAASTIGVNQDKIEMS